MFVVQPIGDGNHAFAERIVGRFDAVSNCFHAVSDVDTERGMATVK